MSYIFERFDDASGSLTVRIGESRVSIDVPIEDGKYITGEALHSYVRGLIPIWAVTRASEVQAVSNPSDVHSMCEIKEQYTYEPSYKELRAKAYPPIAEYMDAVVKGDQAALEAYRARCLEVKAMYPKPEPVSAEVLRDRLGT